MQWRRSFGMWLLASLFATCIPSRNFMGGARTWQLCACRRVHLLRRLHIRSLLAVFLLNFVFFPHGRRPYWRESLAFFPHKRSTGALGGQACLLGGGRRRPRGTLGGQACLGWPRCLVCGLALHQNGELLSFGPPTYVQQTGFATRGPAAAAPYVGTAALPKLSPKYRDERILSVPHAMRMGAQHMQPSPFNAVGLLKAQIIPSQPSPLEVA